MRAAGEARKSTWVCMGLGGSQILFLALSFGELSVGGE